MIYGVEGATVPHALAQLSASCNERGHNRRAASTCRLRVSGRVCVYRLVFHQGAMAHDLLWVLWLPVGLFAI